MPKNDFTREQEAITGLLATFPSGLSREEIGQALQSLSPSISLNTRTLQRRLQTLVDANLVEAFGETRQARYRLRAQELAPDLSVRRDIILSTEAESIRDQVRKPLHERTSTNYNRDFLEAYQPNHSYYLNESIRLQLATAGRTPGHDLEAGTYARQIYNRLLIDLSWNSSRLEGNTYSLLETERLLQLGESVEGKAVEDAQMILNHKAAIELLVDDASSIDFNRRTILNLHALLSDNLLSTQAAGGRLRSNSVGIRGTNYNPLQVPQLIEECFEQILTKAAAIINPFEQAFFAMVHLPYLQPFEDVNKRVSRLAANIPLIRHNLCPLSFVDMPTQDYVSGLLGVYELNRTELLRDVFAQAYLRSCQRYATVRQVLGEPDPFRLRYRKLLIEMVGEVVRKAMNKKEAVALVQAKATEIPTEDRNRLVEVAETELQSLHEGNYARYRVRPSEFDAWQVNWR